MFIQKQYLSNTVIRLILALILALMIAGCSATKQDEANVTKLDIQQSKSPVEAEQAKSWTFTDTSGKEITLDIPVQKAVVINRNTAEAIKLLGAAESIAATGDNTIKHNSYLGFDNLPDVGEAEQVNLETVLGLKPEVVFTYTNRPDHKLEEKLEPAGIKVVRMNNYLPEQMDTEWKLLGKLFGKEESLEWKHEIERIPAERIQSIDPNEKKSVLALSAGFLNSNGGYRVFPSQSLGGRTGVGEGYATILAGGRDAADLQWDPAEASTTIMVDEEYVLKRNPDVVTLHGTWLGGYETMENKAIDEAFANMLNISSLNKLNAGKDREVYFFHTNFIGSDKRYIGVLQLAKWLYPDRFQDVDPDAYAKEYFEEWLGVPYQGIWYYSFKEKE